MKRWSLRKLAFLLVMVRIACMLDSAAQTFSVTANFDGGALNPEAALIEGFDGGLYGT